MRALFLSFFQTLSPVALVAFASGALAASQDVATFSADGKSYTGTHVAAEKLISVNIDGLTYKGHYAAHAGSPSGHAGAVSTGDWGRAFLFASSAKVMQCQLKAGFPGTGGQCQDAQGQQFKLTLGGASDVPMRKSVSSK